MTKVLVLDGNQRSALTVARALGRAGYGVYVGDSKLPCLASQSKYCRGQLIYSDPVISAATAAAEIFGFAKEESIDLVFPMTDITTHLVLSDSDSYKSIRHACPPLSAYQAASDKGRLVAEARECGVPVPHGLLMDGVVIMEQLPEGFDYPVVLKPTLSRIRTDNGFLATTVKIAHSAAELVSIQQQHRWFKDHPWLLQSFIQGTGQGVFSIYDHGRPVAWFAHERIREKPPTGGVSVLSRSAPLEPRLKEAAKTLLDALDWHGPAMVEFRVTDDGTPYLMEINARFWGSLQLAVSSGINFPLLAAQIAMGEHPEPVEDYRVGVYNRWLLGDLDNLYLTLKAPKRDFSLGQKFAAIGKFMLPWWPGLHYEVNQWGDLGPFWRELKQYLR